MPLASLAPDPRNPRFRSERARSALARSMRTFGPARSAVIDGRGRIVAGNGTVEAAMASGVTDALVVDAPPGTLVVVRKGFTEAEALAYGIADNQVGDLSVFDEENLVDSLEELEALAFDLEETGFDADELDILLAEEAEEDDDDPAGDGDGDEDEDEDEDEEPSGEAPDDLFRPWPSDNEWGVPTLDLALQGARADLEGLVHKWGTRRRGSVGPRLVHCFADDYKFWGLHKNPRAVVDTGCQAAIEPNYSTRPDMARAEALWWLYSKRAIARWWQDKGLRVFVDLNVDPAFADLSLLGVPPGWRAYATRWQRDSTLGTIRASWAAAVSRRGSEDVLLVVFGGGDKVRQICHESGWSWLPEDSDVARGRA